MNIKRVTSPVWRDTWHYRNCMWWVNPEREIVDFSRKVAWTHIIICWTLLTSLDFSIQHLAGLFLEFFRLLAHEICMRHPNKTEQISSTSNMLFRKWQRWHYSSRHISETCSKVNQNHSHNSQHQFEVSDSIPVIQIEFVVYSYLTRQLICTHGHHSINS